MRVLKLFLISILAFSLLIVLLSLLFPSTVRISRAINIGASASEVSPELNNLERWKSWNEMISLEGLDNQKISNSFFSSDQMTIAVVSATPDSVITVWKRQDAVPVKSGLMVIPSSDSTTVQWYFDFKLDWYPWEKFGSIIFDKQLGPPMERSLANLKKIIENKPSLNNFDKN